MGDVMSCEKSLNLYVKRNWKSEEHHWWRHRVSGNVSYCCLCQKRQRKQSFKTKSTHAQWHTILIAFKKCSQWTSQIKQTKADKLDPKGATVLIWLLWWCEQILKWLADENYYNKHDKSKIFIMVDGKLPSVDLLWPVWAFLLDGISLSGPFLVSYHPADEWYGQPQDPDTCQMPSHPVAR